jgi:hypothetical protein
MAGSASPGVVHLLEVHPDLEADGVTGQLAACLL